MSVGDFESCSKIATTFNEIIEKNDDNLDDNILEQLREAIEINKTLKSDMEALNKSFASKDSPFMFEHDEKISSVVYRESPLTYVIKMVIKEQECWKPENHHNSDNVFRTEDEVDSNLELILEINREDIFGVLYFSSLGTIEGKLYENEGKNSPYRGKLIKEIGYNIASDIYFERKSTK